MILDYPEFFPKPNWQFSAAKSHWPERTNFESGWSRQRKKWQDSYTAYDMTFEVDTVLFDKWNTWVQANGYNFFRIILDDENQTAQTIRFITPLTYSYTAYDKVVINVSAEQSNVKENPPPSPPWYPPVDPVEQGGCLEWTIVDTGAKTATAFWTSPTGDALSTFNYRIENDLQILVKDRRVLILHGANNIYETTNFGGSFTDQPLTSYLPVDSNWAAKEKTSATFSGAAFPNGVPSTQFAITGWEFVGNDLWCCALRTNGDQTVGNYASAMIIKERGVVHTGWGWRGASETNALRSTQTGAGWYATNLTFDFTFVDGQLFTTGTVERNGQQTPYPDIKCGMFNGAEGLALQDRGGAQYRVNSVNGDVFTYGHNGASGDTQQYYQIKSGVLTGRPYSMEFTWNGVLWVDNNPMPTFQADANLTTGATTVYPATREQRPQKWFANGSQEMTALARSSSAAGTSLTFYTSMTNGVREYYGGDAFFANQYGVTVVPVAEKGAYVYVEASNSLSQIYVKVSATGRPGTFTQGFVVNLPVKQTTNTIHSMISYSASEAKFLYTYLGTDGLTRVVTFDDPFVCSLYENL